MLLVSFFSIVVSVMFVRVKCIGFNCLLFWLLVKVIINEVISVLVKVIVSCFCVDE